MQALTPILIKAGILLKLRAADRMMLANRKMLAMSATSPSILLRQKKAVKEAMAAAAQQNRVVESGNLALTGSVASVSVSVSV